MLIYKYEAEVLAFIHNIVPSIREMTYSPEENLLTAMTSVKYMPYMHFWRQQTDWEWNRPACISVPYEFDSAGQPTRAIPTNIWNFEQKYVAHIVCESTKQAFEIANALRVGWNTNYKVYVNWFDAPGAAPTPVQLRLLYIKVTDIRLPNDKVGSARCVELCWQSMLITTDFDANNGVGLVEIVDMQVHGGENDAPRDSVASLVSTNYSSYGYDLNLRIDSFADGSIVYSVDN